MISLINNNIKNILITRFWQRNSTLNKILITISWGPRSDEGNWFFTRRKSPQCLLIEHLGLFVDHPPFHNRYRIARGHTLTQHSADEPIILGEYLMGHRVHSKLYYVLKETPFSKFLIRKNKPIIQTEREFDSITPLFRVSFSSGFCTFLRMTNHPHNVCCPDLIYNRSSERGFANRNKER